MDFDTLLKQLQDWTNKVPLVILGSGASISFGLGQFIVHGIVNNIKMRSFYNPGLFSVVFMHVPIGIYYINYIYSDNLVTSNTWLFGLLYLALFMFAFGLSLYKLLANKNTKWPFTSEEINRFDMVRKVKELKS